MTQLLDCGHEPSTHSSSTTGYGIAADGTKHCYECCAKRDREQMIADGQAMLYLTTRERENGLRQHFLTNWPGSLEFKVAGSPSESWHNWARKRYDVWFRGPDGFIWHGYQVGDMTQICHCRRTKRIHW